MKLITKNSQIVVGGVYNLINKTTRKVRHSKCTVHRLDADLVWFTIGTNVFFPEDERTDYYWELVSYPPRRPVNWAWVKENIDQVPGIEAYDENIKLKLVAAGNDGCFVSDGQFRPFDYPNFYIDPPHPKVPDVPAPWETKTELQTRKQNGTVITEIWFDENKPAEEKKSLWWFGDADRIIQGVRWLTYSEAKVEYRHYEKIQPVTRPVHEGPDENAWSSV